MAQLAFPRSSVFLSLLLVFTIAAPMRTSHAGGGHVPVGVAETAEQTDLSLSRLVGVVRSAKFLRQLDELGVTSQGLEAQVSQTLRLIDALLEEILRDPVHNGRSITPEAILSTIARWRSSRYLLAKEIAVARLTDTIDLLAGQINSWELSDARRIVYRKEIERREHWYTSALGLSATEMKWLIGQFYTSRLKDETDTDLDLRARALATFFWRANQQALEHPLEPKVDGELLDAISEIVKNDSKTVPRTPSPLLQAYSKYDRNFQWDNQKHYLNNPVAWPPYRHNPDSSEPLERALAQIESERQNREESKRKEQRDFINEQEKANHAIQYDWEMMVFGEVNQDVKDLQRAGVQEIQMGDFNNVQQFYGKGFHEGFERIRKQILESCVKTGSAVKKVVTLDPRQNAGKQMEELAIYAARKEGIARLGESLETEEGVETVKWATQGATVVDSIFGLANPRTAAVEGGFALFFLPADLMNTDFKYKMQKGQIRREENYRRLVQRIEEETLDLWTEANGIRRGPRPFNWSDADGPLKLHLYAKKYLAILTSHPQFYGPDIQLPAHGATPSWNNSSKYVWDRTLNRWVDRKELSTMPVPGTRDPWTGTYVWDSVRGRWGSQ